MPDATAPPLADSAARDPERTRARILAAATNEFAHHGLAQRADGRNEDTDQEGGTMTQRLGIIMNGVTGRMGTNQHLVRSIVAIRDQGGVALSNGDRVMPDPILVGRSKEKL